MIITCEKCLTKFNLNENVLKKDGSKVRCTKCRYIFKAYPPSIIEKEQSQASSVQEEPSFQKTSLQKTPLEKKELQFEDDIEIDGDTVHGVEDIDPGGDKKTPDPKPPPPVPDIGAELSLEDELSRDKVESGQDSAPGLDDPVMDFSLEDELQDNISHDPELNLDMNLDLSMDDDISPGPSPGSFPGSSFGVEPDMDMDMDFSIDDESSDKLKKHEMPAGKTQAVSTDDGLELDMDFSDDFDLGYQENKSEPDTASFEDDLDMDFSIDDGPSASPPDRLAKKSSQNNLVKDNDLDFSFAKEEDTPSSLGMSREVEEDTLEIEELEDDEGELDFSVMDQAMGRDSMEVEDDVDISFEDDASSDVDFSADRNLMVQDDDVLEYLPDEENGDSRDDDYGEEISDEKEMESDALKNQGLEDKNIPSNFSTQFDETSLSGQRPHLFSEKDDKTETKRSFGAGKIVLSVLFLLIVAIAGYAGAIMTGVQIPYISDIKIPYLDSFISVPAPEPVKLTPVTKSIASGFIDNSSSGTLFVIRGEVINHSAVACKNVIVESVLLSKDQKELKRTSALCGNTVSDTQLKTLDIKAMTEQLNKRGASSTFTVNPSQTISFVTVFSNFPEDIDTFTITVANFEQIPQKK
ncbi:MAG: zinc-ribbon domain-containing protein [Desulfamplus sp.]|nr:zinc-ribbon domain-containing protein [Desulfamplus sp.]